MNATTPIAALAALCALSLTAQAQPGPVMHGPLPELAVPAPRQLVGPPVFAEYPQVLDAVRRFERLDPARARKQLLAAREQVPGPLQPALDYLVARCDLQLGWDQEADAALVQAAQALPALSRHIAVLRAQAALDRGDVARAEKRAAPIPPHTAGVFDLHLALAERGFAEGRHFTARAFAERAARAVHWGWDQARLASLQQSIEAAVAGDPDPARRVPGWIALWRAHPRTDAGREALDALAEQGWPAPLTVADLLDAVDAHARRKGARWRRLVDAGQARFGDGVKGLYAYALVARAPRRWTRRILKDAQALRDRAPAAVVAERLPTLEAQALRHLGKVDEALAKYAAGAAAATSPGVKGWVAYEGARLARKLNRVDAATVGLLETAVAHLHPTTQAKARAWALWSLGFVAWRNGRLPTADRVWRQLIEQHPMVEDHSRRSYYERALYWQARAWAQMGRVQAARRQWRFVRDRFPYSYYAVLAHHRLPDAGPWAPPVTSTAPAPPASVPLAHADAVWLWRLGLVRDARDTLRHRENLGALDHSARQLLSAAYRARNDWYRSHWILQHHDPLDVAPTGAGRARWLAAYPRPFEKAVRHQAAAHQVDPLLLWAVMRQESGFRPRVGSPAGALGLMQVLPATAAAMARRLKEAKTPGPAELRRVWPNVHYGAAFLARLLRRYKGHEALTLAAYNAGPGHVDDWLDRIGHLEADAFVEAIPFDEARGYVRKVLRSYAAYRALYRPEGGPWRLPPPHGHRPGPAEVAER